MKRINTVLAALGVAITTLTVVGIAKKPSSVYRNEPSECNPMEGKRVRFVSDPIDEINADGKRGHLEVVYSSDHEGYNEHEGHTAGVYERYTKRVLDILLSGAGLILLSPLYLIIAVWIYLDSPGPVLFTQKRVGRDKQYFRLHKFRSMRMSTPHDIPTHQLIFPEQYITRSGRFIRKHSLDELPQVFDIWLGNMSVIGPRPALWNQDWLTACRDEVAANDIKPGLTGWAQINGRDELSIPDKAKLDGEYASRLSFWFDIKCFIGSIGVFTKDDSVVEGGTGSLLHK